MTSPKNTVTSIFSKKQRPKRRSKDQSTLLGNDISQFRHRDRLRRTNHARYLGGIQSIHILSLPQMETLARSARVPILDVREIQRTLLGCTSDWRRIQPMQLVGISILDLGRLRRGSLQGTRLRRRHCVWLRMDVRQALESRSRNRCWIRSLVV